MTTPLTTDTASEAVPTPTRATRTLYAALIINSDLTPALDALYETEHERRDAVVDALVDLYEDVTREQVDEILAPFGGAIATVALGKVIDLVAELDYEPEIHLGEHVVDNGPLMVFSAVTVYGDGSLGVEHYGSAEDRLKYLRERAEGLAEEDLVEEGFDAASADEAECKRVIEGFLAHTDGKLHLTEAERVDNGDEIYLAYGLEG